MNDKYSMIAFGHIISKRRKDLGRSYTKLYKLLQIDIRAIKSIELENKNATLKTVLRLLNTLKLNIVEDDLIFK